MHETKEKAVLFAALAFFFAAAASAAPMPQLGKTLGAYAKTVRQAGWTGGGKVPIVPVADVPGKAADERPLVAYEDAFKRVRLSVEEIGGYTEPSSYNYLAGLFDAAKTDKKAFTATRNDGWGLYCRFDEEGRAQGIFLIRFYDNKNATFFQVDRRGRLLRSIALVNSQPTPAPQQRLKEEFEFVQARIRIYATELQNQKK
jgi:hypothetical protein